MPTGKYYFHRFGKEWECEFEKNGDRLDEAAYESMTGHKKKTVVMKIADVMLEDWRRFVGEKQTFLIFAIG